MSKYIGSFRKSNDVNFAAFADGAIGEELLKNDDTRLIPVPNKHIINIVEDHSWFSGGTLTSAAKAKIPQVTLIEKEQVLNSQLSQALYYLGAITKGAQQLTGEAATIISSFAEKIGVNKGGNLQGQQASLWDKLKGGLRNASADPGEVKRLTSNYLSSIIGLYLTEDTEYKYVFPYFDNPPDVRSNWDTSGNDSALNTLTDAGINIADQAFKSINIAQPGIYIQKAQHYQFASAGPSFTIKFPLFNTVRSNADSPYKSNYEFLWLLAYQNKPYKTSFARATPGKIYDVSVPGLVNFPFAYISNLQVDFVGTVRNKTVEIGDLGSITAPIPDAYDVTIEITSLLSDYANTMVGAGFGVSTITNPAGDTTVRLGAGGGGGVNVAVDNQPNSINGAANANQLLDPVIGTGGARPLSQSQQP